jgi:hypothetical protein
MDRTVFLISDQNWQDVLSLVPIAIWTESSLQPNQSVHKIPTLIYHREANGIDVDSTLHFLCSYLGQSDGATVVPIDRLPTGLRTLLEDHCGLQAQQIQQETSVRDLQEARKDDIDTWVIVARNDYRSGLVAAAFASLHHAFLLFIDAGNLANYEDMTAGAKTMYLVGDLDEQVKIHFAGQAEVLKHCTCEEIQQLYLAQTRTDKIILVNPDDLELQVEERSPSLPNVLGEISRVYGRMSLAAPFLAAAKHELILTISSTNPYTIDYFLDDFVKETMTSLNIEMRYLTIMASPEAIPMAMSIGKSRSRSGDVWIELDGRHYASLGQNEAEVDLAVGRIFGITVSDCSAYVARVLSFDDLHRQSDKTALLIMAQDNAYENGLPQTFSAANELETHMTTRYWTSDVRAQFDSFWSYLGEHLLNLARETPDPDQIQKVESFRAHYQEATLILYTGHADCNGVRGIIDTTESYYREMYLNFPVIIGVACLTGAYEWIKRDQRCRPRPDEYKLTNLFVAQNIRRGAMGQQCAIDYAYWHEECDELLRGLYVEGLTLGEAFRRAKNAELERDKASPLFSNGTDGKVKGDPHYVLVGDPTFIPKRDSQ